MWCKSKTAYHPKNFIPKVNMLVAASFNVVAFCLFSLVKLNKIIDRFKYLSFLEKKLKLIVCDTLPSNKKNKNMQASVTQLEMKKTFTSRIMT